MLFMCCQLALEVQDGLQCLAKQLNPSLGQTEPRARMVWLEWRSPAAGHWSHTALGCASALQTMELGGSSADLAGLCVCLCVTSRAPGSLLHPGALPCDCAELAAAWGCVEAKKSLWVPPVCALKPPASPMYYCFPLARAFPSPPLQLRWRGAVCIYRNTFLNTLLNTHWSWKNFSGWLYVNIVHIFDAYAINKIWAKL